MHNLSRIRFFIQYLLFRKISVQLEYHPDTPHYVRVRSEEGRVLAEHECALELGTTDLKRIAKEMTKVVQDSLTSS